MTRHFHVLDFPSPQ